MSPAFGPRSHKRTVGAEDGRDILLQRESCFDKGASPDHPSRASAPACIAAHFENSAKNTGIRPLPRAPPTPRSALPAALHLSQCAARPLPSIPAETLSILITPPTPLSPPTASSASATSGSTHWQDHVPPRASPPCGPRPQQPSPPLRLETSPDILARLPENPASASPSPTLTGTPTTPAPPTPRTAQRNSNSKLRRHLGASVQVILNDPEQLGLLYGIARPRVPTRLQDDADNSWSCSDASRESDNNSENDEVGYVPPSTPLPQRRVPSRKWVRERGKRRWTEKDYTAILQDLRSL
ncbi:hypothetical protein GGX14DRAFT_700133 [Mycena pura]|uniref:Uncharacterized protein n=1 Tax=Mycena pura TaxID=153505 RepID=A0AAD6V1K2_9AGAR|nr:hypothetical protein GGX14DRAFT_700133 [Mycena pura]